MRLIYWTVFFVIYGFAHRRYQSWLAQRRIAALAEPSQFAKGRRILAFSGICFFAVAPPLLELAFRICDGKPLANWQFVAFIAAWIASLGPGVLASRRALRAGGIDPDADG